MDAGTPLWTGFIAGVGVAAWAFGVAQKKTGGANRGNSIAVAVGAGVITLLVVWSTLSLFFE